MTDREFLHQLRRGIGSAIIELKQNENREKYKEIVYRCCMKDIGYDIQLEGTKGHYLYTAILALGCKDEFLNIIEKTYMDRLPDRLMQQYTDILFSYIQDGSSKAADILNAKYNQLKDRLAKQKVFPNKYCEREQFEELLVTMITLGSWRTFKQCIEDIGIIIRSRQDDQCSCYDWFLCSATNKFGKDRVWKYLDNANSTSQNVHAFTNDYNKLELIRENHQVTLTSYKLEDLLEEIKKCPQTRFPYEISLYQMRFARKASKDELIELAEYIKTEHNEFIKAHLIRVFRRIDYPLNIDYLIDLVYTKSGDLRNAAITALERLKDERLHDLAIMLLEENDVESGLAILQSNWKKTDDSLIRKAVTKSKRVTHSMQMYLRHIYSKHRSSTCGDVLIHAYKNGECSYCRSEIVIAMAKSGVLPDKILFECQYDSYNETRRYAQRLMKRRKYSLTN